MGCLKPGFSSSTDDVIIHLNVEQNPNCMQEQMLYLDKASCSQGKQKEHVTIMKRRCCLMQAEVEEFCIALEQSERSQKLAQQELTNACEKIEFLSHHIVHGSIVMTY